MVELLHIDCMEYMAGLPDKSFDLAIVDPPYGIGHTNNKGQNNLAVTNPDPMKWNKEVPTEEYFRELFRVSKNQIIWGVNYYPYSLFAGGRIVWDKKTTGDFSDCEIAYCSLHRTIKKFTYLWNGMIQQDNVNREIRIHPTQKPVKLYRWLLHSYAKSGDTILDTHGGSRSLAIACHQMGFNHVSCEINQGYHDKSCKRFKEQTMQQKLFL